MTSSNLDHDLFLLRYAGEVTTKGKGTRLQFQRRLGRNIQRALDSTGLEGSRVEREWSRIFVRAPKAAAMEVLPRIFGLQSFSPVVSRPWKTLEDIVDAGEELFGDQVVGKVFAVRTRRGGDKKWVPFRSAEVDRALGDRLYERSAGVDLENPDVWVRLEIRVGEVFFFQQSIPCPGGLPLGTEGSALALVSGGFDSGVAAWNLLKRGVQLDYLFCNLGGTAHLEGVLRVMKLMASRWSYGYKPRLYAVDLQDAVAALQESTDPRYWQILLKRLMFRAADRVARRLRVEALVTGEAVGQVSSQTLRNLRVIEDATDFIVLRPLIGLNKDEIIDQARRIGTYELSAVVPEYCALEAKRPATHARFDDVLAEEAKLPEDLIQLALDRAEIIHLARLDSADLSDPALAVDDIPADAVVIDLRSATAYQGWHYPKAQHLDYFDTQRSIQNFEEGTTYVLYCEVGLKSAHAAEILRGHGRTALHFRGGLRSLLRYTAEQDAALAALASPVWFGDS